MTVLSAIRDPGIRGQVQPILEELSDLTSEGGQQDPADWPGLISALEAKPEILLLELIPVADRLTETLREVRKRSPQTGIVILHQTADPQCILQSMRAGADEFVHAPWFETLGPALDRVLATRAALLGEVRQGKVIGFLSAKGGCGATTCACHVAAELHRQTHEKVLLADLDLVSGMVGFLMKTDKPYSALDVFANLSRLDESLWSALVAETKPGLWVLPAPSLFSPEQHPSREDLQKFLAFARGHFDWIVLDLGRSLNPIAADLYDAISQVHLVSVLEASALHGVKTILRRLNESGRQIDPIRLILNRAPKMLDISSEELARILGRPIYAMLPNDYQSLQDSYSKGGLLSPNSHFYNHFSQLASRIANLAPKKPTKRFQLFR